MIMTELIEKKRDGYALSAEEIRFMIEGFTKGDIPDYQMAAMAMAIVWRGMTKEETLHLTQAMEHSGDTVDLSELGPYTADKHSTGGVGDKTSLVLCPMVAACGACFAKMSGRGLGHTGGTIDKLESFPGFDVSMGSEQFLKQAKEVGIVIVGQSGELAPADKKLYALRDVTGTVPAIPLIASSIMSKKLASGSKTIVLDVKTGSGAFMETDEQAAELATEMVELGRAAGRNMGAVITDMNQPLGFAVGNALEVKEAITVLKGGDVPDLRELCLVIGSQILLHSGLADSVEEALARLEEALRSGAALDKLADMVEAQGGDRRAVYDVSLLPAAKVVRQVASPCGGYIAEIESKSVGHVSLLLGGGRVTKESEIDLSVGVVLKKKAGAKIAAGDILAEIHAASEADADKAEKALLDCYRFCEEEPTVPPLIHRIIG